MKTNLIIGIIVLIVILLIAFGMRIFNSTSDVSGQATDTGKELSNQTQQAASAAQNALQGIGGWRPATY